MIETLNKDLAIITGLMQYLLNQIVVHGVNIQVYYVYEVIIYLAERYSTLYNV